MQIYALLFSPPPTFITIQCYFLFWEWGWDNRKESVQKEYCKSVLTLGLANGTLGDFLAKSVIILYNRQFPLQKGEGKKDGYDKCFTILIFFWHLSPLCIICMSCAREGQQCYLGGCRLIAALITAGEVLYPGKTINNNK